LIEAFSYDQTDAVDSDGARQSAKQLKRIADIAESATRDSRPLKVEPHLHVPGRATADEDENNPAAD
jgi:hypothetical protein